MFLGGEAPVEQRAGLELLEHPVALERAPCGRRPGPHLRRRVLLRVPVRAPVRVDRPGHRAPSPRPPPCRPTAEASAPRPSPRPADTCACSPAAAAPPPRGARTSCRPPSSRAPAPALRVSGFSPPAAAPAGAPACRAPGGGSAFRAARARSSPVRSVASRYGCSITFPLGSANRSLGAVCELRTEGCIRSGPRTR